MSRASGGRARDPLLWAATQIRRRLSEASAVTPPALSQWTSYLAERQQGLARAWRQITTAEQRGWHLAARRKRQDLLFEARRVEGGVAELLRCLTAPTSQQQTEPTPPSLQSILDELRQLEEEFEGVEVDRKQCVVTAKTEPVVLEGLALGPFAVELHIGRLAAGHLDSSCFECVALEPNSASCNEEVTHPHVQGGALCAGDASVPIATALQQGRVCDAFCLVRAVLQEYNPQSPYVSIEDWEGVRCSDCDALTHSDDLYCCEGCGSDVCDDCYSSCDVCGCSRCRGCLERDEQSGSDCCRGCRRTCSGCGRMVDADSFVDDSKLCPECDEDRQQQQEEVEDGEENDPEADHTTEEDQADERPTEASPADAAAAA